MKILGIGTDIVDIRRVASARYLDRVAEFFLLEEELADMRESRDRAQFVASRIAAKEAVIKAFPAALGYHDFSIRKEGQKPVVFFSGLARSADIFLSIAHEAGYATSVAIAAEE